MAGTLFVHTDPGPRKVLGEVPGTTGMVEMDVGDGEDGDVVDPDGVQGLIEMADRTRRAALDDHPVRGVEEIAGESFGLVVEIGIDEVEVVAEVDNRDGGHDRHASGAFLILLSDVLHGSRTVAAQSLQHGARILPWTGHRPGV